MKKNLSLIAVCLLFIGFQKPPFPLTGKWQLDGKQSKNLPESFKSVEQYTMDVQQQGDSVIVVIGLKGSGQDVKFPPTIYMLSGKEMFRDDTLRFVKRWSTAQWLDKEKKFTVTNKVIQRNRKTSTEQQYNQTDVWEFHDDTLHIAMTQKFPVNDSTYSQVRIFERAK